MLIYSDEKVRISRTYAETTPESAEDGDYSDSGFIHETEEYDVDSLASIAEEHTEKDSAAWWSTDWWTTDYTDGTERQECVHLAHDATDREQAIWDAITDDTADIEDYDPELHPDRDVGLPVPFIYMGDFNKVQGNLAL